MVMTNNVLCFLAGACHPISTTLTRFTPLGMKDINGNVFRMRVYGLASSSNLNVSAVNNTAQIGKGTTPPNNLDFQIENPFTNGGGAEEDSPKVSTPASYNDTTDLIEMQTAIVAGGSGDITEVCKFVTFNDEFGTDRICLVLRDIISPVGFIAGETINILHEVAT